jgi:small subunit ribosomal protein S1
VTKVVTFGAFVEILPGVEGLVHISELAQHHVENPREVVSQGQAVNVLILEIDADRRRLSLSLKRVEEGASPRPRPGAEQERPSLDLSSDVFTETPAPTYELAEEAVDAGDETDPAAVLESLPVESLSAGPAAAAVAEEEEAAPPEPEPAAEETTPAAEAAEDSSIVTGSSPADAGEPDDTDDNR